MATTNDRASSHFFWWCYLIFFSLLTIYALLELSLETLTPLNRQPLRWCAAWLCPMEFSSQKIFTLTRELSGSRPQLALADLVRAVRSEPGSAYAWADLGEAYLSLHRADLAIGCFQRALAEGPNSPAILARAGNLYFTLGDREKVMLYFRSVLEGTDRSNYHAAAFLSYTRMEIPVQDMLKWGVPPTLSAGQAFLRFLMAGGRLSDSQSTWEWINQHRLVDNQLSSEYLAFLIGKGQEERAAVSWADATQTTESGYRSRNWVFNGDFECQSSHTPLDWNLQSTDDARAARSEQQFHSGKWSLGLAFSGERNIDFHGAFEETVLRPGKWHLKAFLKTQQLTTDKGVAVRVFDARRSNGLDVKTPALTGDHDWTKVEVNFSVPADTKVVRLEIVREPSTKLDNKVAGNAWVDSLELKPIR